MVQIRLFHLVVMTISLMKMAQTYELIILYITAGNQGNIAVFGKLSGFESVSVVKFKIIVHNIYIYIHSPLR